MSALPTIETPSSATLSAIQPTRVSVSHSLKRQARSSNAHRWTLKFGYALMPRAHIMQFYSFLLNLRGQADTFTTILPGHTTPQGSWAGTPVVAGASQTGAAVNLSGFTASQTGIVKAGDLLQFAGHTKVYMATADASSSGTGTATVSIRPALMQGPANGEAVASSNVAFTVALASDSMDTSIQAGPLYALNIDMVEVY